MDTLVLFNYIIHMDKKIIAGFIATFIVSVLASWCLMHCQNYSRHNKMTAGQGCMMANTTEKTMGHSMDSMEHQMMTMTGAMAGKTGNELDKAFLQQMIVHHQGAVAMAELLAKDTKRPELQKMAKEIIDVQTKEIDQMDIWLTTWFSKN